jgi:hypothetical protein
MVMRLIILPMILLGSWIYSYSQNYKCFYPTREAFYFYNDFWYNQVFAVRIDSIKIENNDTVYYNYYNFYEIDYECYSPYYTSWLGRKIIITTDGFNLFINHQNDTIYIKTNAKLNESWVCFSRDSEMFIEATVISYDTLSFLNLTDSVKTISFCAKNISDEMINHPVNSLSVIISRSNGMIKTLNFNNFPDIEVKNSFSGYELNEYNLVGLTNPDAGVNNLTWLEINDFNAGDEFHYEYTSSYMEPFNGYSDYEKQKTIKKVISRLDKTDTVCNEMHITKHKFKTVNGNIKEDTIYSYFSKTCFYPDKYFDRLPNEPVIYGDIGYENLMFGSTTKWKVINCLVFNNSHEGYWIRPTCDGCFINYEVYTKGLGLTGYECSGGIDGYGKVDYNLVYYKKGDFTWGNPLIITNIPEKEKSTENKIQVFPNPFNHELSITSYKDQLISTFKLYTIPGTLVYEVKNINQYHYAAKTFYLHPGIYFYEVILSDGTVVNGKLLKH